jgi:Xaa-Pro aminopeptidase
MAEESRPVPTGRVDRLQHERDALGLDALLLSSPLSIRYVTGFGGSAGLCLIAKSGRWLVVDGRYEAAVREGMAAGRVLPITLEGAADGYERALASLLGREQFRRVGFEARHVTVATLTAWQHRVPGVAWHATDGLVEHLRVIKDDDEIEIFRRGGRLMANVAAELPRIVQRGRTEQEVAAGIERALTAAGFAGPSFPTIVASGPHSAHPHARPTSRQLDQNDLVVLDFGGVLDGYCLDLTRMAVIGHVTDAAAVLFDAVRDAHTAALASVRPGVETAAIDAAAREVLQARGLGEAFLHSTGHGLGLEIHEAPRLARASADTTSQVTAGMIFTIEPGAYVEHLGGVRLEDDVLVTATGSEVLTPVPRDLLVV